MLEFGKEYFYSNCYFYLKDRGNKFSLYYSVGNTLKESKDQDSEIIFLKEDLSKIKNFIKKLISSGKKFTKDQLKKFFDKFKNKESEVKIDGELDEFIGDSGTFLSSNIPMLNQRQVTKKTNDQTEKMTKARQYPYFRNYYGESEENKPVIDEIDQSESFGFEETDDAKTYNQANKILKKMAVSNSKERDVRLKRFGFDKNLDRQLSAQKKRGHCKNCYTKRRLVELEKDKMKKIIDEILLNKKNKSYDVIKNNDESDIDHKPIFKLLVRNIESIKRVAEKEGISVDKLIKHFNTGE